MGINLSLFHFFNSFANKSVWFDTFAIFVTNYLWVICFAFFVFLYWRRGYFKPIKSKYLLLIATPFIAISVTYGLKHLINSPRPIQVISSVINLVNENGFDSFPSNHTTFMVALAFMSFYFGKKIGYIFTAAAVLVAISRMVVGAHFPIDILGGIVVGLVVAVIVKYFVFDFLSNSSVEKRDQV